MIFIDRSIPRPVADALKSVRDDVLWLEDRFDPGTKDPVWLKQVGLDGWIVVSRDTKIRTRSGEVRAVIDYKVGLFCLTQKQPLTRWSYLKLLAATLDEMERVSATVERPFIYGVGRTGEMRQFALRLPAAPPG